MAKSSPSSTARAPAVARRPGFIGHRGFATSEDSKIDEAEFAIVLLASRAEAKLGIKTLGLVRVK